MGGSYQAHEDLIPGFSAAEAIALYEQREPPFPAAPAVTIHYSPPLLRCAIPRRVYAIQVGSAPEKYTCFFSPGSRLK